MWIVKYQRDLLSNAISRIEGENGALSKESKRLLDSIVRQSACLEERGNRRYRKSKAWRKRQDRRSDRRKLGEDLRQLEEDYNANIAFDYYDNYVTRDCDYYKPKLCCPTCNRPL